MQADVHRRAKATRLARERRYFTRDKLGALCAAGCGLRMPRALLEAGITMHPMCGPSERLLPVNQPQEATTTR